MSDERIPLGPESASTLPEEYKETAKKLDSAKELASRFAGNGIQIENSGAYLRIIASHGHNEKNFFPIEQDQLDQITRYYPHFKLKISDLQYEGDSDFMMQRSQIHNLTAGILYWSICKTLYTSRVSHWPKNDQLKLTSIVYQAGPKEFSNVWRDLGPFENFEDLRTKIRTKKPTLMMALLRATSIFKTTNSAAQKPRYNFDPIIPKTDPTPKAPEAIREQIEYKKTVEWNKKAIPTFDDGPDLGPDGKITSITTDLIKASYEKGVNNIEFYWLGANLLNKSAWRQMGLVTKNEVPRTGRVKPGHWIEWIDQNKPSHLTRQEYIKTLLHPDAIKLCQKIKALKHPDKDLADLIGYHGITHEASGSGRHIITLTEAETQQEIEFFQEIIRAAFDDPSYQVKKGRTPYGSGLNFKDGNPAMKHHRHNAKITRAAQRVNPNFKWNAWTNDSIDWKVKGSIDTESMATKTVNNKDPHYILMHERYYKDGKIGNVSALYDKISEKSQNQPRKSSEKGPETKLLLELGEWTKPKINALLKEAQQIRDPNKRMDFMVSKFMRTPFHYESQLPIPDVNTLRLRLETFDCVTFIYYMIALTQAKNFDQFAHNMKTLRYLNPENGINSNPDTGNIFDFSYNSLHQNAIAKGFLKDVTQEVGGSAVRRVSTVLNPVHRDSKHDRKRQIVRPKLNEGQRVSTYEIPQENYDQIDTSKIKDGDIILFTLASNSRVIITHTVIAKRVGSRVHFIHASKKPGVSLKRKPVNEYLEGITRFRGFIVMRPQNLPTNHNQESPTLERMVAKNEKKKPLATKPPTPSEIAQTKSKDDTLSKAKKEKPQYFTQKVNENLAKFKTALTSTATNLFQNFGLNPQNLSRSANNFLELALRREMANHDTTDNIQEWITKHVTALESSSIGPLEIKPATYVKALMKKNGLTPGSNYKRNVQTLIDNEVILAANQIWYRLITPSKALQAYQDILAMYIPKANEDLPILVKKDGKLKKYQFPKQSVYTMSTKEGTPITYTHDEMRLMCGVAQYQGVGLRFFSPDKDVKIAENDQVVVEKNLVLNNTVSEICTA